MRRDEFSTAPEQLEETELLLEEGRARLAEGALRESAESFRRALAAARRVSDQRLADLAFANAFSVEVELQPTAQSIFTARSLFLRSTDPVTRFICCTALARHYHSLGNYRLALFYGRVAHVIAPPARRGGADHLLGILLLACGKVDDAMELLRNGLHSPKVPPLLSLGALAYGASLLHDHRASRRYVHETEALFEQSSSSFYDGPVHLALGYTALELCEPEQASIHARQALACLPLAPSHDHKAALFLAGETALQSGCRSDGEHFLDELQRLYFPQLPNVTDLLVALRTSAFVNWLA